MNDDQKRECCDTLLENAAIGMVNTAGASVSMIIDRFLTYAAAQAVSIDGSKNTAQTFRQLADRIDAGMLAKFDPAPVSLRN